mmetsp:Transcript_25956/g.65900  ORF Transcript_25956/g.65900 Transcript_25956/m.65900 type:complete len:290 (+) Transcript_25956:548-1417(+)
MRLDTMTPTPLLNLLRLSTLTALAPSSARSPPPPCSHQPGAQLKRSRQSVPLSTLSAKAKKAESMSSPCPHQPGAQMKRSRQPIPLLTLSTKAKKAERMSSPPWETTHFPKKGTNPKSAGQCQAQLQWPLVIRKMIDQVSARRNPSQSKLPPFQSPLTLPLLLSKKKGNRIFNDGSKVAVQVGLAATLPLLFKKGCFSASTGVVKALLGKFQATGKKSKHFNWKRWLRAGLDAMPALFEITSYKKTQVRHFTLQTKWGHIDEGRMNERTMSVIDFINSEVRRSGEVEDI